jgi:hypothetical protein
VLVSIIVANAMILVDQTAVPLALPSILKQLMWEQLSLSGSSTPAFSPSPGSSFSEESSGMSSEGEWRRPQGTIRPPLLYLARISMTQHLSA